MVATLQHPYATIHEPGMVPLRCNLHAHTTLSDGRQSPQQLIDAYAQAGYDFLAITDHDRVIAPRELAELDARGMILIAGNEVTADGPHINHIGALERIKPHWRRERVLDGINADRPEGFAVVNHPNWQLHFDHCSIALLLQWCGYIGVEIFNGKTNEGEGSGYALEKWDMCLSAGRRVWGFANDDTHDAADVGHGWNVVFAPERSELAILDAIRNGRFYASTGVEITKIAVNDMRVELETANAQRLIAVSYGGKRLAIVDDRAMTFDVPPDVPYVRFECWGQAERFAWTQPMFIEKA